MNLSLNDRQLDVLRWIIEGCAPGRWSEGDYTYKLTAVALQNRGLANISKTGGRWHATATDAGCHYSSTGSYPPGHRLSHLSPPIDEKPDPVIAKKKPVRSSNMAKANRRVIKRDHYAVDSPLKHRTRTDIEPPEFAVEDPWESKILVSVKEAAWTLSVSEALIREAVLGGDIQRVFIGQGDTKYRIVYQSFLTWVNSMPTEGSRQW